MHQALLPIFYRRMRLDITYRVDFICFNALLLEIKALPRLTGVEESQVLNYLKASPVKKALQINFGAASMEFRRFVLSDRPHMIQVNAD